MRASPPVPRRDGSATERFKSIMKCQVTKVDKHAPQSKIKTLGGVRVQPAEQRGQPRLGVREEHRRARVRIKLVVDARVAVPQ